jgi:hypothetical protein
MLTLLVGVRPLYDSIYEIREVVPDVRCRRGSTA